MITICFTYFKTLTLANLAAALFSVRQQDFTSVERVIIVDNDTPDSAHEIRTIADALAFPVPVDVLSYKHGDPTKTHAWSTNRAVREAATPWVFCTRADFLLDFDILRRSVSASMGHADHHLFVTGNGCFLHQDIGVCETTPWRRQGLRGFTGTVFDYTIIDTGVWMMRRETFDLVEGLDESLSAWGHAQTDFQYRLYGAGVTFAHIPEVLYYHPQHAAPRDLDLANRQLAERGGDLHAMWARYGGAKPY